MNAVIIPKRKLRKIQSDKGKESDRVPKNTKDNDGERFCTTIAVNSPKIISNIRLRMIRRKREEGRRKKEEGRRKKEEGKRKKGEGKRKKEEGRRKKEEGRRKREEGKDILVDLYRVSLTHLRH
ncbi:MAG: hypothetical protein ACRCT1_22025 [Microcoleaceae cyanobacterium]